MGEDAFEELARKLRDQQQAHDSCVRNGAAEHRTSPTPPGPEDVPPPTDEPAAKPKISQATRLVRIVRERAELWHTPDGELYATVEIDGHSEYMRLAAKQWRQWLAHVALTEFGCAAGSSALRDATGALAVTIGVRQSAPEPAPGTPIGTRTGTLTTVPPRA